MGDAGMAKQRSFVETTEAERPGAWRAGVSALNWRHPPELSGGFLRLI
jgi:hypothetical protein